MESPRKVGWTAQQNTLKGRAGRGTCRGRWDLRREGEPGAWLPLPFLLFRGGALSCQLGDAERQRHAEEGARVGGGVDGLCLLALLCPPGPPTPVQDGEIQGGGGLSCGPSREGASPREGAARPSFLHNKHSPVWVLGFPSLDTQWVGNSVEETLGLILNLYLKNKQMPRVPASSEATEIPPFLSFPPKGV